MRSEEAGRRVHWTGSACPSGKRAHVSRASARTVAKEMRRAGDHVRPYECATCGYWHVGHLPQAVMYGVASADEVYRR